MAADAQARLEPRRFRIFISYASQDAAIAEAVGFCLRFALGELCTEVNLDRWFLQPGVAFRSQIQLKLQETDVFIIVYTGTEKPSHGYTGWEAGYFDRVMETSPGRRKIALYLDDPPAVTADEQGIPLGLGRDKLAMTCEQFESQLVVEAQDPICLLLEQWQAEVEGIIEQVLQSKPHRTPEQEATVCVRNLKLAIFRYLKSTVETTVKPQKQITIRVKGAALEQSTDNLPLDAELRPMGSGAPMGIFGLQDTPITWEKFLASTANDRFGDAWRDAITSVVMSAFPDRVDVDNSQIILSSDEVKCYRVVLTTATKYYDDYREFSVYFVGVLPRADYGDRATSILLKGLELVCHFRFMFLEEDSEFSNQHILASHLDRIPDLARRLLKELNLLRKDAREAGLDEPNIWRRFVTWEHIQKMSSEYEPRQEKLRDIISRIAAARTQPTVLAPLRVELASILEEMENAMRPENALLLREMTEKLDAMVRDQERVAAQH